MNYLRLSMWAAGLLFSLAAWAQDGIASDYAEPDDGIPADTASWQALGTDLCFSWASKDVLYQKRTAPALRPTADTLYHAWRGERLGVQAVLFSRLPSGPLRLRLRGDGKLLRGSSARFVNYVLSSDFRGCGVADTNARAFLVPDVIDRETAKPLEACTTRPVWCTIEVPRTLKAGRYALSLDLLAPGNRVLKTLTLQLVVSKHTLPEPKDYQFNLNYWMQPYAVSRYYGLKPWSREHLDALRPYMQLLARAGQGTATAILFYEPWGEQSNDKFEPMVETTRHADGTWSYDYAVFDRWITFLESCGIDRQINCFSMVPWDMSFRYRDAVTGQYAYLKTKTSTPEYKALWTSFLQSFARHLRQKGWYEKTVIAMDERSLEAMRDAYRVAQEAVPGIKMSLAGTYHQELVDKMYDYCIGWGERFTPEDLALRNGRGYVSTTYTCCSTPEPNICSNNLPVEAVYLPLYCVANGFNGYLHWSWMNWTDDPLRDTRFRLFSPGDTYLVYPGARSGVHFERFIEGVQAAEKVRVLREEYTAKGDLEALNWINQCLRVFSSHIVDAPDLTTSMVNQFEEVLNLSPMRPGAGTLPPATPAPDGQNAE